MPWWRGGVISPVRGGIFERASINRLQGGGSSFHCNWQGGGGEGKRRKLESEGLTALDPKELHIVCGIVEVESGAGAAATREELPRAASPPRLGEHWVGRDIVLVAIGDG